MNLLTAYICSQRQINQRKWLDIFKRVKYFKMLTIYSKYRPTLSPEYRCPFNGGNRYKHYANIFPGTNFVSAK